MVRQQKNDRICPICGKKFRLKSMRGRPRKYCSDKCYEIAQRRNVDKRVNLGTSVTLSLTPESVEYQLFLIKNNIDKGFKIFSSDKSKRDVILELTVFDKERGIIREVYDND